MDGSGPPPAIAFWFSTESENPGRAESQNCATGTSRKGTRDNRVLLKREVHPGAGQPEVVLRAGDDVPTKIGEPSQMRRDPDFKATAHLRDTLGLAAVEFSPNDSQRLGGIVEKVVAPAPAANSAA